MAGPTLEWQERLFHRDRLRAGRYAALADSEGFLSICFALEALGLRLLGKKCDLGKYLKPIRDLSQESYTLTEMPRHSPHLFGKFDALYDLVRQARNDAMHTGVYARHATAAAIELCIGIEEALMKEQQKPRKVVSDYMVKSPITVDAWLPVAHARQLMLTHSFSFIPVKMKQWMLISEVSMAKYLHGQEGWGQLLAASVQDAAGMGLGLLAAQTVSADADVSELLNGYQANAVPPLWLVQDEYGRLCGVLSPFELM